MSYNYQHTSNQEENERILQRIIEENKKSIIMKQFHERNPNDNNNTDKLDSLRINELYSKPTSNEVDFNNNHNYHSFGLNEIKNSKHNNDTLKVIGGESNFSTIEQKYSKVTVSKEFNPSSSTNQFSFGINPNENRNSNSNIHQNQNFSIEPYNSQVNYDKTILEKYNNTENSHFKNPINPFEKKYSEDLNTFKDIKNQENIFNNQFTETYHHSEKEKKAVFGGFETKKTVFKEQEDYFNKSAKNNDHFFDKYENKDKGFALDLSTEKAIVNNNNDDLIKISKLRNELIEIKIKHGELERKKSLMTEKENEFNICIEGLKKHLIQFEEELNKRKYCLEDLERNNNQRNFMKDLDYLKQVKEQKIQENQQFSTILIEIEHSEKKIDNNKLEDEYRNKINEIKEIEKQLSNIILMEFNKDKVEINANENTDNNKNIDEIRKELNSLITEKEKYSIKCREAEEHARIIYEKNSELKEMVLGGNKKKSNIWCF